MVKSPPVSDSLARQSDVTVSTKESANSEYTGFFINVLCTVVFTGFILWCLVPSLVFEKLEFDYLPNKYWSIAIPAYSLMLMLYIYGLLALYNTEVKTLHLNDVRNFIDEHSVMPPDMVEYVHKAPSGVWDLPVTLVNEVLYNQDDE